MGKYTLYDLEKLTGIKADTIRIWEKRYGIIAAQRTATNRRWYTDDELRRMINVSILNRNGIKISAIAALPADVIEEKTADLIRTSADPDMLSGSLIIATTRLDEDSINEILLRSVIKNGFEGTFSSVVFPFLKKIGVLWHTGSVNVGTEHFISNILRRKLIAAFENLHSLKTPGSKKILMFLPENEFHELGLLYYAYIARRLGHQVLYLGQTTPLDAAVQTGEEWNPDIIITGALSGLSVEDPEEYILRASACFKSQKLIFTGILAEAAARKRVRGVFACRSDKDLIKLLR